MVLAGKIFAFGIWLFLKPNALADFGIPRLKVLLQMENFKAQIRSLYLEAHLFFPVLSFNEW